MTQEQALNILIKTAAVAVKNGGFTLGDAKIIAEAVEAFKKPEEKPVEVKE